MALFGPGVVIIPPDKETSLNPYVPGVIMAQADGSVIGAVPNTVTATSDGAVLSDGTMAFNDHLSPLHLRVYDTDFNQIADNVMFTGVQPGVATSPPAPCSDFDQWFYAIDVHTKRSVRRLNKDGTLDGTTWTLSEIPNAFAVDPTNTWFYFTDNFNLNSWILGSNSAGPVLIASGSLPADYSFGATIRVCPNGNILATMYKIVAFTLVQIELWQIAGLANVAPQPPPGTILTKTVFPVQAGGGQTDETLQVDVGFPNTVAWLRCYDAALDRADPTGCLFSEIRLTDGVVVNHWRQTIAQVDGGIPGGILPATCPLVSWTASTAPAACAVGIPSPPPTNKPACAPNGISGVL